MNRIDSKVQSWDKVRVPLWTALFISEIPGLPPGAGPTTSVLGHRARNYGTFFCFADVFFLPYYASVFFPLHVAAQKHR
jgi:hypothetical protein